MWWSFAALIIFCAVYFHSKTDPGTRFAIETARSTNYGPSWWDQQKFGPFTPGDLAVFAFAYTGLIERLGTGRLHVPARDGVAARAVDDRGRCSASPSASTTRRASPFGDWRDLAVGAALRVRALVDGPPDRPGLPPVRADLRRDHGRLRRRPADAVRVGRRRDRVLRPHADGRPRHPGVHGGRGRHLDGDAANATGRGRLWWAGIIVGTAVVALAFRRYAWVELGHRVRRRSSSFRASTGAGTSSRSAAVAGGLSRSPWR